jgi:hypothetical protein
MRQCAAIPISANTLKIYTKGERVLRIEVIVHNTKELRSTCHNAL